MRFLKLRTDHNRTRRDGSRYITPLIVDAPRRYAPSHSRKETSLRRTRCQLITGAHDSGKSRWLSRLRDNRHEIWGRQPQPVLLEGLMPLSSWVEIKGIETWYATFTEDAETQTPWARLNLQQKADLLADYLLDTQALLFIDDAHKLTGRKAQSVARFAEALANRNHAYREIGLYLALEARSQARVKQGIANVTEQVGYLEKVAAAQRDILKFEAQIVEQRLALSSMCDNQRIDQVNRYLQRLAYLPPPAPPEQTPHPTEARP